MPSEIKTERLILRPWRLTDIDPFVALNADPCVMEFFPAIKTRAETLAEYHRFVDYFNQYGWGFWAVSIMDGADFIGFIGLRAIDFPATSTPAVEIGWRLAYDHWGKGYATEGARAALRYGFEVLALKEIISFTSILNLRSAAVMQRIGMQRNPLDDFEHPKLCVADRLCRHLLYRLHFTEWQSRRC